MMSLWNALALCLVLPLAACHGTPHLTDGNTVRRQQGTCEGYNSSGMATVQNIAKKSRPWDPQTGKVLVTFKFTPSDFNRAATSFSMTMSYQCALDEGFNQIGSSHLLDAWISQNESCEPSGLRLTQLSCTD